MVSRDLDRWTEGEELEQSPEGQYASGVSIPKKSGVTPGLPALSAFISTISTYSLGRKDCPFKQVTSP